MSQKQTKVKKPYVWVTRVVVISAMRRAFRKYPAYKEVLNEAKEEIWIPSTAKKRNKNTPETKRRVKFKCACCGEKYERKKVFVDHIIPVVDVNAGFTSLDVYADRLFCDKSNLQVLCVVCHNAKTKDEVKVRAKAKREKKICTSSAKNINNSTEVEKPRASRKSKRSTGLQSKKVKKL